VAKMDFQKATIETKKEYQNLIRQNEEKEVIHKRGHPILPLSREKMNRLYLL
jgi:hypothetical protein